MSSLLAGSRAVNSRQAAVAFVVVMGVVSLFADVTYEGARSIIGPYLRLLGASATAVGVVAGLGELAGYGLRLFSGYVSDRTRQYWAVTIAGYVVNMLAVPLLALAGAWEVAALLILAERAGKAVRTPARDAMLSHASTRVGHGWAFGLHEALDQVGAVTGPLLLAAVLSLGGAYETAFAVLLIPALLALTVLLLGRLSYPNPRDFELELPEVEEAAGLPRSFWLYLAGVALIAAAYADFPLIAFHIKDADVAADGWVPVLYAAAMGMDAAAALGLGRLFDRVGMPALLVAFSLAALFPALAFSGSLAFVFAGVLCWGVGLGAQESVMRAVVARLTPPHRRATAFGVFNFGFGVPWFLGSALMGFLYDQSVTALIAFSMSLQLGAVVWLLFVRGRLAVGRPAVAPRAAP